jgi:putative DNA primase/helicase
MRATTDRPEHFRRELLPAIDDYCARHGLTWRHGRTAKQRWDCPLAEHSHRGNLLINAERGTWFCVGSCGKGDVLELHMRCTGLAFREAAIDLGAWVEDGVERPAPPPRRAEPDRARQLAEEAEERARKAQSASAVWAAAQPIGHGTPAHAYLVGRGCVIPPADGDLRWLPRLARFELDGPALVGRISRVEDAAAGIGVHLTWLALDGGRWRRTERRYLGAKGGGVVRLWPDEAVDVALGVAEGIETALAAAHAFRPVWACMDAGNLAALPVLPGIGALTVFADHDANGVGQRAAAEAARAWVAAGREVRVVLPETVGHDVVDEVAA